MEATTRAVPLQSIEEWFERRSYVHTEFADIDLLSRKKRELGLSLTVVLPAREVARTIGGIVDQIRAVGERAPLVDQLVVVDADSPDGSAAIAAKHGAEVYLESELLPGFGPAIGKGDAMWRALSVVRGELAVYLDSDTTDFGARFVYGLCGPLLTHPELRFVKAAYSRPLRNGVATDGEGSGRVTELTARPLFNLFYPELTGFAQPLAGEIAAPTELLRSIPFFTGYAVEAGMLIDVLRAVGLHAMAQVDVDTRTNRNQGLLALSKMSYEVLRAVELRLRGEGRLSASDDHGADRSDGDLYIHATRSAASLELERSEVKIVERPPMAGIL
jgi:glucosyl-3-phosphoglycerate synthase